MFHTSQFSSPKWYLYIYFFKIIFFKLCKMFLKSVANQNIPTLFPVFSPLSIGTLLFASVEQHTGRAVITRGKLHDSIRNNNNNSNHNNNNSSRLSQIRVITSPSLLVGGGLYPGWPVSGANFGPLLRRVADNAALFYHTDPISLNSFTWQGGYRFAGIAMVCIKTFSCFLLKV